MYHLGGLRVSGRYIFRSYCLLPDDHLAAPLSNVLNSAVSTQDPGEIRKGVSGNS